MSYSQCLEFLHFSLGFPLDKFFLSDYSWDSNEKRTHTHMYQFISVSNKWKWVREKVLHCWCVFQTKHPSYKYMSVTLIPASSHSLILSAFPFNTENNTGPLKLFHLISSLEATYLVHDYEHIPYLKLIISKKTLTLSSFLAYALSNYLYLSPSDQNQIIHISTDGSH